MPPTIFDVRKTDDVRDVVHRAVQALSEGRLIVIPTETVYGVAALGLHEHAVSRLREVKSRKGDHPLPLAIRGVEEALDYAPDVSPLFHRLARRCWPGPVTLVVDASHPHSLLKQLPRSVKRAVSPHQTVGLRVPGHNIALDVLRMIAGPLVLTSANRAGDPEAKTAQEAAKVLGDDVAMILDDGPCRFGSPSSVVRVRENDLEILREGVVPERAIKRLANMMVLFVCTGNTCRSPMAEWLFRKMAAQRIGCQPEELEENGLVIRSAGIAASVGGKASPEALEVLSREGLDLSSHETQPVNETLVRNADVIYTMTPTHRQAIVSQWPDAAQRTMVLAADGTSVVDPIGGSCDRYKKCAEQISSLLSTRLEELNL